MDFFDVMKGFRLRDVAIPNKWVFTSYQKVYINFSIRNYLSASITATTSIFLPTFPPSKQVKQPDLCTAGTYNLFNPIKGEDDINTGSEPGSLLKKVADSSHSIILQL